MKTTRKHKGKLIVAIIAALSLTVVLLPTAVFAGDTPLDDFEQYIHADAGEQKEETVGAITSEIKGGIWVDADNGGTADVTVNGDVNVVGEGVKATSGSGGDASVSAGDITSTGDSQYGVDVMAWDDGSYVQAFVGDVTADQGFHASSNGGDMAYLNAGDITVPASEQRGSADDSCDPADYMGGVDDPDAAVINDERANTPNSVSASGEGAAVAEVGNIDSAASGLSISAMRDGQAGVQAGLIDAAGFGMDVRSSTDGMAVAGVKGINAGGVGIRSMVMTSTASNMIEVRRLYEEGQLATVEAGGMALQIINYGETQLFVYGNAISSENAGLYYYGYGAGSSGYVLVTDTVSGGTDGVLLTGGADKLDLTVWEIKAGTGEIIKGDEDGTFAKTVDYIIKIEQPQGGAAIYATKADGSPLDKKYTDEHGQGGYEVAHEGDIVLLQVDLQPGYKIYGAYNGTDEKVPLLTDAAGNYYVVVPKGGGIYLSVDVDYDGDGGGTAGGGDSGSSSVIDNTPAKTSGIPQTGDSSHMILWIGLLGAGFLAVLALVIRKLVKR